MVRKLIKVSLITFSGMVLLMVSLGLLLASGLLNEFLAGQAIRQTGKIFNGQIVVDKVEGNPLKKLTLSELSLVQDHIKLASIDQVDLEFSLGKLLQNELLIDKILINHFNINILQQNDSLWNINNLLLPVTEATSQASSDDGLKFRIKELTCTNLTTNIVPIDSNSIIPKRLDANFRLAFQMQAEQLQLEIKSLQMKVKDPEFEIRNLSFNLKKDTANYLWDNLSIQLPGTKISSSGNFLPRHPYQSNIAIDIDSIALDQLQKYLPGVVLKGTPSLHVSAKGENERAYISAELKANLQSLKLAGWIKDANAQPTYDLHLDVKQLDGSYWTGNPDWFSDITGAIQIFGRGLDFRKDTIQVSGNFPKLLFQQKILHDITFHSIKEADHLSGLVRAETWFGGIRANYQIDQLFSNFAYHAEGSTTGIDLAKLDLPYQFNTSLNLNFDAKGAGYQPLSAVVRIKVKAINSTIFNRPIEDFNGTITWNKGYYNLSNLVLWTPYFRLQVNGRGNPAQQNKLQYEFESKELKDLFRQLKFQDISLHGKIKGEFSGNSRRFASTTQLENVDFSVDKYGLDGVNGNLFLSKDKETSTHSFFTANQFRLDTLTFQNLKSQLELKLDNQLSGHWKFASDKLLNTGCQISSVQGEADVLSEDSLKLNLQLKLDSLQLAPWKTGYMQLSTNLAAPVQPGKINAISAFHQTMDHYNPNPLQNFLSELKKSVMRIHSKVEVNHLAMDSMTVQKSTLDVAGHLSPGQYEGRLLAKFEQVSYAGISLQEGKLSSIFTNNDFRNRLELTFSDTVKGVLNSNLQIKDELTFGLQKSQLVSSGRNWNFGSDSTYVTYGKDQIRFQNLALFEEEKRRISAEGIYSFHGKEDLAISLEEVNLANVNKLAKLPFTLSGIANSTLRVQGTAALPIIRAVMGISDLHLNGQKFGELHTEMNIANDTIQLSGKLQLDQKKLAEGTLHEHYHFSLEDQFKMPPLNTPISAQLTINQTDISMFQSFIPADQVVLKGVLEAHLKANGMVGQMNFDGKLSLNDGKLQLPDYGIDYDRIQAQMNFSHDSILIKKLVAQAGSGTIAVNGYSSVKLKNGFEPTFLSLKIIGNEFKVVDSDRLQATVNTAMLLKKEDAKTLFSGDVEVVRSSANADILMSDYNKVKESGDQPLLLKAKLTKEASLQPEQPSDTAASHANQAMLLYKNLSGSFKIRVPGNMWIHGKEMGLEVKGDLQAMKEGEKFVLFGELDVKRGFYKMYGKRFDFVSGKITLTGEDEINPILDFDIAYPFRDLENKQRALHLKVSGRLKEPLLSFEIDNKSIEEQDAISYLVFGSSVNELTQSQESAMNLNASGVATNMAMSQMSAMLKDVIQSSLKLDVVEISGDNNWSMGSVKVGKYIGNNLYISYQYNFALDKKTKVIEPMVISIEYQFLNFLSLSATNQSANTGFDLIYKKEF